MSVQKVFFLFGTEFASAEACDFYYILPSFFSKMPTVILLDVSLSMSCPLSQSDLTDDPTTKKQLAARGINAFLDHLSSNLKLEFVSLVSSWIFTTLQCSARYQKSYFTAVIVAVDGYM